MAQKIKIPESIKNFNLPELGIPATIIACAIAALVGTVVGTQLPLLVQFIFLIITLLFCNNEIVKGMELGGISYMVISVVFIVGMIVGDVSYFFQVYVDLNTNIPNPFSVH